jgi:hypothetical protein
MRDPVKRTISHYWHDVRWHSEHRNILQAIRQKSEYTDVSHYAMQLEPFFKIFGQDKVFTLTFEELTSQPEKTVKKIMSWLGVSDELCFQKTILKKT